MRRAIIAATGLVLSSPLWAATFTVTRLDDPPPNGCLSNDCSLREAVIAANLTTAPDLVQLGNGTHELTRVCVPDTQQCQDLDVTQPLTIQGNSSATTEILNSIPFNAAPNTTDRGHTRVIEASAALTLRNLRLRRGYAVASNFYAALGGCLLVQQAASTLDNVVVTECSVSIESNGNSGGGGVAIANASSTWTGVTVSNSSIYGGRGGGVYVTNTTSAVHSLSGSAVTITGNRAGYGGGAYVAGVSSNGGAVLALGGKSRITTNTADGAGGVGGLGNVDIRGNTGQLLEISHNLANVGCGGVGVENFSMFGATPNIELRHLRIANNVAKVNAGGICISSVAPQPTGIIAIRDSELANNSAGRDGGALRIGHSQAAQRTVLERVSLWRNIANRGAAVYASNGTLTMANVSSFDNDSTTGAIQILAGSAQLRHVTSLDDSISIDSAGSTTLSASVMSSNCAGLVQDDGYNVIRSGVAGCPGTAAQADKLALAFGDFGGPYPVVGISSSQSLLRDIVPGSAGASDVRGWLRQNLHDIGAHEYDGVQP